MGRALVEMQAGQESLAGVPGPAVQVAKSANDHGLEAVQESWQQVRALLIREQPNRSVAGWLDRLEPLSLRAGVLTLATRSGQVAQWVRTNYERLIGDAVTRAFGSPLRVRIEKDESLGGALFALGIGLPPKWQTPPPYVSVSESRVAHRAVLEMARNADPAWSRLVIQGGRGMGKSHLVRLFLSERQRHFPRERWALRRGLGFYREFSRACRERRRGDFRGELLAHDGLVIDDLQELAGKHRSQDQLVEFMDYLQSRQRPVLIATEPLPRSSREFLPRFRSTVYSETCVRIPEFSAKSRCEVLRRRFQRGVPDWLHDELGTRTGRPLSECFESLQKVAALSQQLGRMPHRGEIDARLPRLLPRDSVPDPMDRILDRCAEFVGADREAIVSGTRSRGAALGRHLSVYLAFEVFRLRRQTVLRWLGKLSPSILPYVRTKIGKLREEDPRVDGFIREISEEIQKGQRFLFGN